jgi:serine/threonine-protein kinase ATR
MIVRLSLLLPAALVMLMVSSSTAAREEPMLRDFVGVCGHYHFDPPTFAPAARLVRSYHPGNWDLDVTKPYEDPPYPFALNRVNWQQLYTRWKEPGIRIIASLMIGSWKAEDWVSPEETAYGYGKAFAAFFGPSGHDLVTAAELGNEPDKYSDEDYTRIARAMARGLREGDPKLPIATAALTLGPSAPYMKSISCYEGWLDQIDILNFHTYAIVGKWPNRVRTYPEDPESDFVSRMAEAVAWRDENAPGKEVWITEFGWDAHSEEPGEREDKPIHERPSTISRAQQAEFLVRSFLIFARIGADRAYMYFYQDDGAEKGLHNASGLLSSGVKQPAYYAMVSLQRNLGDFRFARVIAEDQDRVYAYLFEAADGRCAIAAWSPTLKGEARALEIDLQEQGLQNRRLLGTVVCAVSEDGDRAGQAEASGNRLRATVTGMPLFVLLGPG